MHDRRAHEKPLESGRPPASPQLRSGSGKARPSRRAGDWDASGWERGIHPAPQARLLRHPGGMNSALPGAGRTRVPFRHECFSFEHGCTFFAHECFGFAHRCTFFVHQCISFRHRCTFFAHECVSFRHRCTFCAHPCISFKHSCMGFPHPCISWNHPEKSTRRRPRRLVSLLPIESGVTSFRLVLITRCPISRYKPSTP